MSPMARRSTDKLHNESSFSIRTAFNTLRHKFKIKSTQLNSKSKDSACSSTCLSQPMPSEANRTAPTEAELFLLLCSLFPVDFKLPIKDLVIYGMALKLFGNVHNISEGMCRVFGLIKIINHQLPPRYLNKLRPWEDKYGTQFVKVFSSARDLAKSIASKYQLMRGCNEIVNGNLPKTNRYEYFYGLSLVPERINKHPTDLFDIFEGVKELRILSLDIPSMPKSLNALCNLRTLHLKTLKLEDISWGCLMNLEFLSISTPCLTDIPEEMGQLSNLRLLDLRQMSIAYIPPGVLPRMLRLEELYFPLSFKRWGLRAKELDDFDEWEEDDYDEKERIGTINDQMDRINASISDITSLSLHALEISVPDASLLPQNSSMFDTIRSFQVFVPNSLRYKPPGKFPFSNVLQLRGDAYDMKVSGICELMSRAEDLSLLKVRNLISVMFQLNVCRFPRLQKMIVSECDDLEYIVDTTAKRTLPEDGSLFSNLEALHLSMLPNLKEIWHGRLASLLSFGNLTQISIRFCNKLKYVFPLSIVGGSTQLKSIQILDCSEMNGIFYQCKEDDTADALYTIENLRLHSLPKLVGFLVHVDDKICRVYDDTDQSRTANEIVPSGMDGSICSLDINFKSFSTNENTSRVNESCIDDEVVICPTPIFVSGGNSQENASHQFVSSKQDSFTMNKGLIGCTEKSVAFISSKSAEKWMKDLKRLEITYCDAIQVIFSFEENPFITRAFNSLIELKLVGLRNLVHIWFQVPPEMTAFQNLQLLVISKCRSLYVFSPCVAELLVQLQKLYINQCERMEEVVMKENEEDSDDKIAFPRLQFLECEHIPNLKVFYSGVVDLPLLECLKINQCNKMKYISYKSTRAPLLKRILINGSLCASMGDLNSTMKCDTRHCETPDAVDDVCSAINTPGSEPDGLVGSPQFFNSPDELDDPDGTYSNKSDDDSDEQDGSEPDELVGSPELIDLDGLYINESEDDSDDFDGCDELNMLNETDSTSTVDMFACEVNGHGNESYIKEFTFADLEAATNNFSSEAWIGGGGSSNVYKGWLEKRSFSPSVTCTGMPVAIKKWKSGSKQGFHEWQETQELNRYHGICGSR